jgi:hypothetical protein
MGEIKVEGRYSNVVAQRLSLQLRQLAARIVESTKDELDSLTNSEQLMKLLTYEAKQVLSQVLREGFTEISGRAIVRPEAEVSQVFSRMRRDV